MNWLTQAFSQYSIVWLVISTVMGLIGGVVSYWILDVIKRRGEKQNRIRNEIIRWSNPILEAVSGLEHRLENILCEDGDLVLHKNKHDECERYRKNGPLAILKWK